MQTKQDVNGLILEELWELCYRAHSWISFSPEKRATQYIREYSEILENDLIELGENQGNYKEKFIIKFSSSMSSKSNCASSVITGGSNFNVRRAEKANNAERNKMLEFHAFREKYFKAVNRQRTLSPEEELDNALIELDEVSNNQDMMKEINSLMRKEAKSGNFNYCIEVVKSEGYPEDLVKELEQLYDSGYGSNFPSFILTNNNSKIKRLKDKVMVMKSRINTKNDFQDITFIGGYLTIEDDRIKIFHDSKPDSSVIQELKSNGFRWSPNWKCWCRKHTSNALFVSKKLTFIKP